MYWYTFSTPFRRRVLAPACVGPGLIFETFHGAFRSTVLSQISARGASVINEDRRYEFCQFKAGRAICLVFFWTQRFFFFFLVLSRDCVRLVVTLVELLCLLAHPLLFLGTEVIVHSLPSLFTSGLIRQVRSSQDDHIRGQASENFSKSCRHKCLCRRHG